ncbi:MAG TPA: hypothetical protein VE177_07710, partial [Candidatus Binatus sp.]|nr:hypothetical protein [Candidatus Binatus sp.]
MTGTNKTAKSGTVVQQASNRLFGTNGIRGIVGEEINVDLAYKIGSGVAVLFKGRPVHLGRDGRVSGRMMLEAVASGLLAQGVDVLDHDLITTPGLQYLVKISGSESGGVIVTASHNPPDYNGFKVIDADGIEIPREKEEFIEQLVQRNHWTLTTQPGRRSRINRIDTYLDAIKKHLDDTNSDKFKRLTIVVDVGNGVSALTTPLLLQRLGCKVVLINGNIDGNFPGRLSEPRPDNLVALSQAVVHEKA